MVRDFARQRLRRASFLGALCAVAIGAAGCSSETSRFGSGNPNSNPYAGRAASYSASYSGPPVAAPAPPAAPIGPARYGVESEPLPQIQPAYSQSYGSQPYGSRYAPAEYDQPQYGSPPRYDPPAARYEPPAPRYEQFAPRYEPPRQSYEPPPPRPVPDYSAAGSGASLSHAAAPRSPAPPPSRVASTDLRAPASSGPPPVAPAQTPIQEQPAGSGQTLLPTPPVYTVAPGDTLGRVAHRYHVSPGEIAVANGLTPEAPLRVGMRLTIPLRTPTFRPARPQVGSPAIAQERPPADPHMPASTPPAVRIAEAPAAAAVRLAAPVAPSVEAAPPNGAPAFRWPARGRVINNYGARVNGSTNDGIDLAVPEGTPVRSADDGVVAYAGSELKGYGNLVLVRHANGFVTAYANGSELLVKRNDQVHKGQVILKSGQTGNAATPQLHFEIRKNSAPVDPMQYLPADKTASAPL
jgi:murein DD-endopeptidase MepM/ murein hydrolase activator NlpD